MVEAILREEPLQREVSQRNYIQSVVLAQKQGRQGSEIRPLQALALKQMGCEYRNGQAVRYLAKEWGFSKEDLIDLLRTGTDDYERISEKKRLQECYDAKTGKYLTLRQWVERFAIDKG